MAEAGLPEFGSDFYWIGMLAPARTAPAIVAKVNHDVGEVLNAPGMRESLLAQGAQSAQGTPAEFASFIESEIGKLKKVINLAGIRTE
jgi:tripartite-type tricarboxylate transporter receptor subunit TctC